MPARIARVAPRQVQGLATDVLVVSKVTASQLIRGNRQAESGATSARSSRADAADEALRYL